MASTWSYKKLSIGTSPKAAFLLKYSLQTLKGLDHKI